MSYFLPFWKKYDIVVSLKKENGAKLAKLAKDFDIPTMTLTAVSKNEDTIICNFFLSAYTRKHDTVSGNTNQITLLTLARLWHCTKKLF